MTTLVVDLVHDDDLKALKNNNHDWERIGDVLLFVQKPMAEAVEGLVVFLLEKLGTVLEEMLDNAGSRCILPGAQEEDGDVLRVRVETMNDVEVKIPVLLVVVAAHGTDIRRNDFFGSVVHDDS